MDAEAACWEERGEGAAATMMIGVIDLIRTEGKNLLKMKNDKKLKAVTEGAQVEITDPSGTTYILSTETVVSKPFILGKQIAFVVEKSDGWKEVQVHQLPSLNTTKATSEISES